VIGVPGETVDPPDGSLFVDGAFAVVWPPSRVGWIH
jgi:hypothetical protein